MLKRLNNRVLFFTSNAIILTFENYTKNLIYHNFNCVRKFRKLLFMVNDMHRNANRVRHTKLSAILYKFKRQKGVDLFIELRLCLNFIKFPLTDKKITPNRNAKLTWAHHRTEIGLLQNGWNNSQFPDTLL